MSFTYNNGVPAAPDNPSVDQTDMLTNTQSINSIIAVDHIGFNALGGGQHKQVTFNGNNVPAVPTTPPVLFTNIPAGLGLPELFYYSGDAPHSSNQYVVTSTSTSGSTFLFGGMILKWGQFTLNNPATSVPITFSPAFPNDCFSAVVTGTATIIKAFGAVGGLSKTGFSFSVSTNIGFNVLYYYIAIGN